MRIGWIHQTIFIKRLLMKQKNRRTFEGPAVFFVGLIIFVHDLPPISIYPQWIAVKSLIKVWTAVLENRNLPADRLNFGEVDLPIDNFFVQSPLGDNGSPWVNNE